jgi:hypothetical protein
MLNDVKRGVNTGFALLAVCALCQDVLVLDHWNAPLCAACAYFYVDMFYCDNAFMLHHACVIALLIMAYKVERNPPLLLCLLNQEKSSLLLNLSYFAPNKFKWVMQVAFAVVFAKCRVYDFYWAVKNPATFEASVQFNAFVQWVFSFLYFINLYWAALILKKLVGARFSSNCKALNICLSTLTIPVLCAAGCVDPIVLAVNMFLIFYQYAAHAHYTAGVVYLHLRMLSCMYNMASVWVFAASLLAHGVSVFSNFSFKQTGLILIAVDLALVGTQLKFDYLLINYLAALILHVNPCNKLSYALFHLTYLPQLYLSAKLF